VSDALEKASRIVVLDTETTGLEASQGHKIIEIGCIELFGRRISGRSWHHYLDPERDIDPGAQAVHGIAREDLVGKPRFSDLADELIAFLTDAEIVIHNAAFDVGFLNAELAKVGKPAVHTFATITDSLMMARAMFPGKKNSLDALCERLSVDNTGRTLHGALLDAQLLAEVYLAMTRGQDSLSIDLDSPAAQLGDAKLVSNVHLMAASDEENAAHEAYLDGMAKKVPALWRASP
jgi:DNA polymerase III subunit epsilon